MRVDIRDRDALLAVSPPALSAYARATGWTLQEPYRVYSDVYIGKNLPEIIVPRTERLGDYASVVAGLIEVFAKVVRQDEMSVYRSLVTADRDVVRLQTGENEDGSVTLNGGVDLISGARDLLLAAACSLGQSRPVYRAGANRVAANLLAGVRLGQTGQGSFVVNLLTPVVPPPLPSLFTDSADLDPPPERRLTLRLMEGLNAAREAAQQVAAGDGKAFEQAVERGVSANLCEALDKIIALSATLDVSVSWARTRPVTVRQSTVRFGRAEARILAEAARSLRERAPRPDVQLFGHVRLLRRNEDEDDGTIHLRASVDRKKQSVTVLLERRDYERAVRAHGDRAVVVISGDLERIGQRWRLLHPRIDEVLRDDECDS